MKDLYGRKAAAGFTLIEMMVVVIIIGILAAMAIPTYFHAQEKAYDKEAIAGLRLIRAADRAFFFRTQIFWPNGVSSNLSDINGNLSLDLQGRNWNYTVTGNNTNFNATATRTTGGTRTLRILVATDDVNCSGACYF